MPSKYVVVSGVLFGAIAVFQAVRALNQWAVQVAGFDVPVWVSWIAVVVAGSLCVWAFRSGHKFHCHAPPGRTNVAALPPNPPFNPGAPVNGTLGLIGVNRMLNSLRYGIAILGVLPKLAVAAEPVNLSADTYKADLGVLIIQVNWGRTWKCGQFENAQLQALTFTKSPIDTPEPVSLDLETPSKLFVDNKFLPYAFVILPGEYVLTAFEVKVARSVTDVAHIKGSKDSLIKEGKPVGGTFTVNPGEVVYVGHFGLDCGAEPFLWRSYIDGREDFEKYIGGFREKFPFARQVPAQYRLFSTQLFGNPFALKDPTVK